MEVVAALIAVNQEFNDFRARIVAIVSIGRALALVAASFALVACSGDAARSTHRTHDEGA